MTNTKYIYLCRVYDRLFISEYPEGQVLGSYDNEQQALVAMQLKLSEDIERYLQFVKELKHQQLLVTRALQNLYI